MISYGRIAEPLTGCQVDGTADPNLCRLARHRLTRRPRSAGAPLSKTLRENRHVIGRGCVFVVGLLLNRTVGVLTTRRSEVVLSRRVRTFGLLLDRSV